MKRFNTKDENEKIKIIFGEMIEVNSYLLSFKNTKYDGIRLIQYQSENTQLIDACFLRSQKSMIEIVQDEYCFTPVFEIPKITEITKATTTTKTPENIKSQAILQIKELIEMTSTSHEDFIVQALDEILAGKYDSAIQTTGFAINSLKEI